MAPRLGRAMTTGKAPYGVIWEQVEAPHIIITSAGGVEMEAMAIILSLITNLLFQMLQSPNLLGTHHETHHGLQALECPILRWQMGRKALQHLQGTTSTRAWKQIASGHLLWVALCAQIDLDVADDSLFQPYGN